MGPLGQDHMANQYNWSQAPSVLLNYFYLKDEFLLTGSCYVAQNGLLPQLPDYR